MLESYWNRPALDHQQTIPIPHELIFLLLRGRPNLFFPVSSFLVGWDLRHQVLRPLLAYCTAPDDR
jgi:hypothetical protein